MENSIIIAGERIAQGTQKEVRLKISEFYTAYPVYIPVIVTHGVEEGPALFVTAAIHGDEINGIEIVRRLVTKINPKELRGTVLCVPVVNIFGFYTMSRNLPDRRDLNDAFPGIQKGSPASRVAYILFEEIIKKCDYGIDIHTPQVKRIEIPHTEADLSNRDAHQLARAFGTPVVINTAGPEKSLQNSAASADIPTIVFSGGEVLRFHENVTEQGVDGIHNVLAYLNMIEFEISKPEYSIIVQESRSVQTQQGGILCVNVNPGGLVYQGDLIARVTNPFGRDVELIKAPETGLIISASTNPLVNPGNEVCAYVMLDKSLGIVEEALRNRKQTE
ncbi:hypothetical protein AMJ80_06980 [bacterium SM23_31]|nr:MAG: hypothetical protein AMJ80_06980 [bacterium SM23_31]